MIFLKLYEDFRLQNEDFDWTDDDFDFEEEIDFISDNEFEIRKFEYNDSFSYNFHRYWLFDKNEGRIVKFFNWLDEITYTNGTGGDELTENDIEKIKDGTIWITNNMVIRSNDFRKWKYDELKDKFNIINV